MIELSKLESFLQEYMDWTAESAAIDRYMANGLQVRGRAEIRRIAGGVSASLRLFEEAAALGADALVVHHSLNMPASILFDRIFSSRLRFLWEKDISLFGYHYLLDRHQEIGHNAMILKNIGLSPLERYGAEGWGWRGESQQGISLSHAEEACRKMFGGNLVVYPFGAKRIYRAVCVSGSGAPAPQDYDGLMKAGIDLFITGEPREWTRELCREAGMNFIAGGHYATEIIGVKALLEVINRRFGVETIFINLPNQV